MQLKDHLQGWPIGLMGPSHDIKDLELDNFLTISIPNAAIIQYTDISDPPGFSWFYTV